MKKGALDRGTFETIEDFVLGRMKSVELARFEKRLEDDHELGLELEIQRENILAVELGGFERELKRTLRMEKTGYMERSWPRVLWIAATAALLIAGAAWWLMRPASNDRLFASYFVVDPGLPVAMGAATDPAFDDAMVAYKLGNYEEAFVKWTGMLVLEPTNDTLLYFSAQAALAEGRAPEAITLLSSIPRDSRFQEKTRWALFLAYVRTGDKDAAVAMGLENDPSYGPHVRAILPQMRP